MSNINDQKIKNYQKKKIFLDLEQVMLTTINL